MRARESFQAWGLELRAAETIDDLTAQCNLIVTTTPAKSPLIRASQVHKGTHITAMGSDDSGKQELEATLLAKADLLSILPKLFDRVVVPSAVVREIERGPGDDPMRRLLDRMDWLQVVQLEPPLSPLASWQLGPGESEVIEYARRHPEFVVLLDDAAGRRAASCLDLKVCGTLGALAFATRKGEIPSFRSAVEALIRVGLYVNRALVDEIDRELHG